MFWEQCWRGYGNLLYANIPLVVVGTSCHNSHDLPVADLLTKENLYSAA